MSEHAPAPRRGRPAGSATFSWRSFFQSSTTPVFVLGKSRRLRYANPAWEQLTGKSLSDVVGLVCTDYRHSSTLAVALTPPPEVQAGQAGKVRRTKPGIKSGPPWWDISYTPLMCGAGLLGIVGAISVVGESVPAAARRIPADVVARRLAHADRFTLDLFCGRFAAQLRHAAGTNTPLWLVGEPGSGKETAAQVIHYSGPRREQLVLVVDCAGLQPFLIESLLTDLDHSDDANHIGTVYLKKPSALPRDLQLRIVDLFTSRDRTVPRLICGEEQTATTAMTTGTLVAGFHEHLSVLELHVPPLRERIEELPRLVNRFLPGWRMDPSVIELLSALPWPGNLRELQSLLHAAASAAGPNPIQPEHLPWDVRVRAGLTPSATPNRSINLDDMLATIEKRLIRLTLLRTSGNTSKAAEELGLSRARLMRRIESLGIVV